MGLIRIAVWTVVCVGMGIVLSTYEVRGKTVWQRAQSMWRQTPRLEQVKKEADELVDGVKKKMSTEGAVGPRERHSKEDREAIDQLITKHSKG
jgi:hypothetical protein